MKRMTQLTGFRWACVCGLWVLLSACSSAPNKPDPAPLKEEGTSMFQQIKAERAAEMEEKVLIEATREPVKIDWKKAKSKNILETISPIL